MSDRPDAGAGADSARRVLLTGATSGLGLALVLALRARGDEVVALVRPMSPTDSLYRAGCKLVEGDVADLASVRRAAQGCEVVVHAAAKVGAHGSHAEFERVNVGGTENVLRAAREAGARRVVHVSTAAVYDAPAGAVVTEQTTLRTSGSAYADSKRAAERAVFAAGNEHGLEVSVVRPAVMYGPYDRVFLPGLATALRARAFVYPATPETPVCLAHSQHVVELVTLAMSHPRAAGEAFNVADGGTVTLGELIGTVCRHLGAPEPPRVVLPRAVVHAAAFALEGAFALARRPGTPPLTRDTLLALTQGGALSVDKARALLGWRPTIGTLEGLARACEALG